MSLEKLLIPPNETQMKNIREALGEDEDRFKNNLRLFEEWVNCQTYFPKNYEKDMLQIFYRSCKFNMDEAKRKLQLFFWYKTTMPELFEICSFDSREQKIAENLVLVPMPILTEQGHRVTYARLKSGDNDDFDIPVFVKMFWTIGHLRVCRETPNLGEILILDATNLNISHSVHLFHPLIRKSISFLNEALPFRIGAIYVINAPAFVEKAVQFVATILKEKIRNRIFIDQGMDVLKNIPSHILPKDLGGTGQSIEELNQSWKIWIQENKNWFEMQKTVKLVGDLPKNLKERCVDEEFSGTQGSFRQLVID